MNKKTCLKKKKTLEESGKQYFVDKISSLFSLLVIFNHSNGNIKKRHYNFGQYTSLIFFFTKSIFISAYKAEQYLKSKF